jgi:hypothetical protein
MIVMNSNLLLEHLTELEEKIQRMESIMRDLDIDWDKENLMELLIACQVARTGRQDKNS